MSYQGSDMQSYQSSTPSYLQTAYSPHFQNVASPNFMGVTSPQFSHTAKSNSIRYGSNSELNKRTRNQSHGYELSQDLMDKQIELLERKYGGKIRAQRAALVSFMTFFRVSNDYFLSFFAVHNYYAIGWSVSVDNRAVKVHNLMACYVLSGFQ